MPRRSPRHAHLPELVALGKVVQFKRTAMSLSQEAFADLASIDRSYMSSIERGVQNVGLVHLIQIARTLDVTLAELFAEADL